MGRRLTQEEFISRSKEKHNNKYSYDKVEYTNISTKVIITCPEHGQFEQTPEKHMNGQGCARCKKSHITTESFIEVSKKIWGDKFDYSKVKYKNSDEKVIIVCPEHGELLQRPLSHLKGMNPCVLCSGRGRMTFEEFLFKADKKHKNKYSYLNTNFTNGKTKIVITCPQHGDFYQLPSNHLRGHGCPACSNNKFLGEERFIKRSKIIWGNHTFDYSKVCYVNNSTKLTLKCNKHNLWFEQAPSQHLKKLTSCPKCYEEKNNTKKHNYWSYERCYEIAKRYTSLSEFTKGNRNCYNSSRVKGYIKHFTWLKRVYSKDENILSSKKHIIYAYLIKEFNVIYIGLTINIELRDKNHRNISHKSTIRTFCEKNGIEELPKPFIIEDNLTPIEAKEREGYWINFYKESQYKVLNKAKYGSLGGLGNITNRWNYNKAKKEVSKYKTISQLQKKNASCYNWCFKHNLIEEFFPYIRTENKLKNFINKATKIHGNKYIYQNTTFVNTSTKTIITCPQHGDFLQTPEKHLIGRGCPSCGAINRALNRKRWTIEKMFEEKIGTNTRNEFKKKNGSVYQIARRNGWLDILFPKNKNP